MLITVTGVMDDGESSDIDLHVKSMQFQDYPTREEAMDEAYPWRKESTTPFTQTTYFLSTAMPKGRETR